MSSDFSMRLHQAADDNSNCPAKNKGRLVWIRDQFNQQTGAKISLESVRRWYDGMSAPRRSKVTPLAKILGVDPVWLETGSGAYGGAEGSRSLPARSHYRPIEQATPLFVSIRESCVIEIIGLPLDLKVTEAQKLANIILAHAGEK